MESQHNGTIRTIDNGLCPSIKSWVVICERMRGSHGNKCEDVTANSLVVVYRRFGGTLCLHFQDRRVRQAIIKKLACLTRGY
jgi:hypothetical protein